MTQPRPLALITGGSRGLGRSTAQSLAGKGADAIITYHSRPDAAAEVVALIQAAGGRAAALQLDIAALASFPTFIDTLTHTLHQTFARDTFDYLVNNGGSGLAKPIAATTQTDFDLMMNIHLKGVFFLTQTLLPLIADGGRIINVSSGLTRTSFPGSAAYAMMKGGLEVFTRVLAKELGARRITVNTVAPGAIATDFNGGRVRDDETMNRMIAQGTALGRAGVPDDIGPMIAALLSDDNRWINAQRIEVSGGMNI